MSEPLKYITTKSEFIALGDSEVFIRLRIRPEAAAALAGVPDGKSLTLVVDGDIIDSIMEEDA